MNPSLFMIIITLFTEVVYYSLFLKYCRGEGRIYRYISVGIFVTLLAFVLDTKNIISYLLLVLTFTLGLKYIVKVRTSLYDMFIVIVMLFLKVSLELVSFLIFYILFTNYNLYILFMILIKIAFIFRVKNKLNCFYEKLKKLWLNNVFKIRYIFICCIYIYVIVTGICLIKFIL